MRGAGKVFIKTWFLREMSSSKYYFTCCCCINISVQSPADRNVLVELVEGRLAAPVSAASVREEKEASGTADKESLGDDVSGVRIEIDVVW